MKTLNKYIFVLLTLVLLNSVSSCSEKEAEYVPAEPVTTAQVYFSLDFPNQIDILPTNNSFEIKVNRLVKEGAISVPITVEDTLGVYNFPSKVDFAAGQETSTIVVGYDASKLELDKYSAVTIKISDEFSSPYSPAEVKFLVGVLGWVTVGEGQFADVFAHGTETTQYCAEVTIEQYTKNPNRYRFSNPYYKSILQAAEWADWIIGESQKHLEFIIDDKGIATWEFWYTGLAYKANKGDDIKAYYYKFLGAPSGKDSKVVKSGDSIKYVEFYPYYYIDGAGGFGQNAAFLAFPGFDVAKELGATIVKNK